MAYKNGMDDDIKESIGMLQRESKTDIFKINRFRLPSYNIHEKLIGYLFIVRPDLNILDDNGLLTKDCQKISKFVQAYTDYPEILKLLHYDSDIHSPFIPIITSKAKDFATQDRVADSDKIAETWMGWKMELGKINVDSLNGGSFTLNFTDDRNLSLYRLHDLWYEYYWRVKKGIIRPKKKYLNTAIDYQTGAYYFAVGEDGETIVYATKLWGVYNTGTSDSSFSTSDKGTGAVELSIPYNFSFKDDYNYQVIFSEFNEISKPAGDIHKRNNIKDKYVQGVHIVKEAGVYRLKFTL